MENLGMFKDLVEKSANCEQSLDKNYCATINKLPIIHRENIFLIIIHYAQITNNKSGIHEGSYVKGIPYSGKVGAKGKGVSYDVSNLPVKLQKLITTYLYYISK